MDIPQLAGDLRATARLLRRDALPGHACDCGRGRRREWIAVTSAERYGLFFVSGSGSIGYNQARGLV